MHKKHETVRTAVEPPDLGTVNGSHGSGQCFFLKKKNKKYKLTAPYHHGWSFNHYEMLSNIENIEIPSSLSR